MWLPLRLQKFPVELCLPFAIGCRSIAIDPKKTAFRNGQLLRNRQFKNAGRRPVHFGRNQTAQRKNGIRRRAHDCAGGDALVYQLQQDGTARGRSTQFTNDQHAAGNGLAVVRLPWISYQRIRWRNSAPKTDGLNEMQYSALDGARRRCGDQYFQLKSRGNHRSCSRPATALSTQS